MKDKLALFWIAAVGGLALMTGAASAMPNGLLSSISQLSNIDEVRPVLLGDSAVRGRTTTVEVVASTPVRRDTATGIKAIPRTSVT